MSDKISIIGAGLAGLNAAKLARAKGYEVEIFERTNQLGGLAVYADLHFGYKTSNYNIHTPQIINILDGQGRCLVLGERITDKLGNPHPDEQKYQQFMQKLHKYGQLWAHITHHPSPNLRGESAGNLLRLAGFALRARLMGKADLRHLMKIMLGNIYDVMKDEIADDLLASLPMVWAVLGSRLSPMMAGTVMTFLNRASGPLGLIDDNSLITYWQKFITQQNIKIHYNQNITAIITEHQRVVGLQTADGQTHPTQNIISTIGVKPLINLVGPQYFNPELNRRANKFRAAPNMGWASGRISQPAQTPGRIYIVNYGSLGLERGYDAYLAGQLPQQLPIIVTIHGQDAQVKYMYSPENATLPQIAQALQASLNIMARDVGLVVDIDNIITPAQLVGQFGQAHWHHGDMTLDQSLFTRPFFDFSHHATTIKGLYIGGAEAHPGGDTSGLSGQLAFQALDRGTDAQ